MAQLTGILSVFFFNFVLYINAADFSVYTQERDNTTFLYQSNMPALSELTTCFWLHTDVNYDGRDSDFILSLAIPDSSDELTIMWSDLVFSIRGAPLTHLSNISAELDTLFLGWHKHCFTWKVNGMLTWYSDLTISGVLEPFNSVSGGSEIIRSGGSLVLLQKQGMMLDAMNSTHTGVAKIAWFNMWDYEMTESELNNLPCRDFGNLVTWDTLQVNGNVTFHNESFNCNALTLDKAYTDRAQAMTFCRIDGGDLSDSHLISTIATNSSARCVVACAGNENCLSADFQISTSICQLNNVIDQGNEADFSGSLGGDYIHFTSRACV